MPRPRLIVCLLLKHGLIVRSEGFAIHQVIGNPMSTVRRLSDWNVDEVILLDISAGEEHDLRRDDLSMRYQDSTVLSVLREVAEVCFMPLTFGGRIRTLQDIEGRLAAGADKCTINSQALRTPEIVTDAARRFGSQCIVVGIDARRRDHGTCEVFGDGGKRPTGLDPAAWARRAEALGAGEIFLNSIDRDGSAAGYDLDLIRDVADAVTIPVIACGGVGRYEDFASGVIEGGASAVAAANIFHFFELSYPLAKQACLDAGLPMRQVGLGSRWQPREPVYDQAAARQRVDDRSAAARAGRFHAAEPRTRPRGEDIRWCRRCVYPSISATPLDFDEDGVCTGCQTAVAKTVIGPEEWARRYALLRDILAENRSKDASRHDCIIPVSGGKDSWFQTHMIKNELGMNPLLVTYNGNNYTEVGWRNLMRMKEVFAVDHVIYSPSVAVLKNLNRLAFMVMGDMNWHAHAGIFTVPVRVAVDRKIPLIVWGEHGLLDLCGQFSMNDFPEMAYRNRLEHEMRGYEWTYFVGWEGLESRDLIPWKYPTDEEMFTLNLRGIYLGNYIPWEANDHTRLMVERYGFEVSDEPFERTYRRMSNLDDMHENGAHDYLKFVKFGYGRCTDHASKDIRAGILSRGQAVDLVRKHDHVKPRDLRRWLDYVGMTEEEFDAVADTFRDPRVWWQEDGTWKKRDLWDDGDPTGQPVGLTVSSGS